MCELGYGNAGEARISRHGAPPSDGPAWRRGVHVRPPTVAQRQRDAEACEEPSTRLRKPQYALAVRRVWGSLMLSCFRLKQIGSMTNGRDAVIIRRRIIVGPWRVL